MGVGFDGRCLAYCRHELVRSESGLGKGDTDGSDFYGFRRGGVGRPLIRGMCPLAPTISPTAESRMNSDSNVREREEVIPEIRWVKRRVFDS